MQLDRHGERIGQEAVALLTAPQCPSGVKTLILDASQTALQIHESCGHPTELDRVFGMEAAYAGTSFMTPEKLNHLQYGSPQVTITAEVKQEWEKKEGERMLRNERYFGNIYRSFTLPVELDESACEATYDNGILELKLVRKAAAPGKRLAIR